MSPGRTWGFAGIFLLGLLGAATAAVALGGHGAPKAATQSGGSSSEEDEQAGVLTRPHSGPVVAASPCGPPITLTDLGKLATFPVVVPNHELANADNILAVNWCPDREVFIDFASGVRLLIEVQDFVAESEADYWARAAAQDSVVRTGVVRGHPAAMADPSENPMVETKGGVGFFENGTLIALTGNGRLALTDLIAVAESLQSMDGASGGH